jgi:hypothetical protein
MSTLKPYPVAEFFPVRRIKWAQFATDRHSYTAAAGAWK